MSQSQNGGQVYYCLYVPLEVRSDLDDVVEHGIGLLWLLGVLCEVCMYGCPKHVEQLVEEK